MKSSLYFGEVRHHRRIPKKHAFCYKVFMVHLFTDEINKVFEKIFSGLQIVKTYRVLTVKITINQRRKTWQKQ